MGERRPTGGSPAPSPWVSSFSRPPSPTHGRSLRLCAQAVWQTSPPGPSWQQTASTVSRPRLSTLNLVGRAERCDWLAHLEKGPRLPEPGAGRSEPGAGPSSSAFWMPSQPLTAPEGPPRPQTHPRVVLSSGRRPRPRTRPRPASRRWLLSYVPAEPSRPVPRACGPAARSASGRREGPPTPGPTRRPAFRSAAPETLSQVTSRLRASVSSRINCL